MSALETPLTKRGVDRRYNCFYIHSPGGNFVSKGCNFATFRQITEQSNRSRIEAILHIVLKSQFDRAVSRAF